MDYNGAQLNLNIRFLSSRLDISCCQNTRSGLLVCYRKQVLKFDHKSYLYRELLVHLWSKQSCQGNRRRWAERGGKFIGSC
jgi:hypothetical protein